MEKNQILTFFIISSIVSTAGGILILVTDFGGYHYYLWPSYDYYEFYINLFSNVVVGIFIFFGASMLFFCTFVSLTVILEQQGIKFVNIEQKKLINIGIIFCCIVCFFCFMGALAFICGTPFSMNAVSISIWLGPSFFGGIIGSGLTAVLFKFYQHKLKKEIKP